MGGEWMIGKFATASALALLVLIILMAAQGFAQTTPATPPAAQDPAAQAPPAQAPAAPAQAAQQPASGQEPADEASLRRKVKPKDFKNWTFNVGAGANVDSGTTRDWVRGGGFGGSIGVARNVNKYLGLRADGIFADLPLRDSTQELVGASGATSYAYAITLDPIINVPVTSLYSGYIVFGGNYVHRAGKLDDDTTLPGSPCNGFWRWWGVCEGNGSISLSNNFVNANENQFGYNFGAGVTRKMPSGVEIYAEYRILHATSNGIASDFRPITIGFRW
jgi:opacity protein-like surface antigen